MNKEEIERIKDLKDIFNKKLENYELDKKIGQLSIDSIYSLFPTEIKLLLDYINQLEKGSYIEEGINGQWTNWKFEAENYKKVCDDLYKKVNQLETSIATKDSELLQLKEELRQLKTNRDEAIKYIETHSFIDENLPFANALGPTNVKKLVEILERGKE